MRKTFFGFKEVEAWEKNHLVQQVFSNVASGYDFMNDVMSLGLHRCWKQRFVESLPLSSSTQVLDVAGGTADIAIKMLAKMQALAELQKKEYVPSITVLDRNTQMLLKGRDKAFNKGMLAFNWVGGDAENLPLPSAAFDLYTISFGIRNVTHREQALKEAWRVLKQGGVFACLEFSHCPNEKIEAFFKKIQFTVIPLLGQWFRGDKASYQYLVESIARFPDADKFGEELQTVGFKVVSLQRLVEGGVAIHLAVKI